MPPQPAEWHNAYPDAKMIGVEGLSEKKQAESWKFSGSYGVDEAGTRYGFEDEVRYFLYLFPSSTADRRGLFRLKHSA